MLPYLSYLRVYEPTRSAEGQAPPPRARNRGDEPAVRAGDPPSAVQRHGAFAQRVTLAWEQQLSRTRVTFPSGAPGVGDDAGSYVIDLDGEAFECPADLPLRSWLSSAALSDQIGLVTAQLLAGESLQVADARLNEWRREHPSAVPHVRQATWGVERTWFLLVDADEREEYVEDGVLSVRFRTALAEARDRLERAVEVLAETVVDEDLGRELSSLGAWLAGFDDDSVLELDYAGVALVLGREELAADRSPEEVHATVAALRQGDMGTAAESYATFQERWRAVHAYERAN